MTRQDEKSIIRKLADEVAEIAHLPIQQKKIDLWKNLNSLKMKRPMVLIYSFPWNEAESVEDELKTQCEDEFNRNLERYLRRLIYKWRYLRADMVIDSKFRSPIFFDDTGFGFDVAEKKMEGASLCYNMHTIDHGNPQKAENYEPLLKNEEDIQKILMPEIRINKQKTEECYERYCELLEPILKVEKCGVMSMSFQPMDDLAKLWGITDLMVDFIERPELIHKAMDRLVDAYIARLDQFEKLNLLSLNSQSPGTITQGMGESYTDELPGKDYDPSHIRTNNMWGGATAQILSEVSPAMHDEFSIQHELRWLERFGLTCYGCCEPLHKKVDILKKIRNLRKISMSSWINIDEAVKNVGNNYVFSYKPKSAFLALDPFDLQASRDELQTVLKKTQEYNCQVEIIMRTIITYRSDPNRLKDWVKMAMAMVGADD